MTRFFKKHCDKCNGPEIKLELQNQTEKAGFHKWVYT